MNFSKFLRTPFFPKEFQWLLLRFDWCFQRSSKQQPVQLSAIITKFRWKNVFAAAKLQKQPPYMSCKRRPITPSTNLFLWILWNFQEHLFFKNISERLLLKIRISVTNLPQGGKYWIPFKPFRIQNFAMTVLLCNRLWQEFLLLSFSLKHQVRCYPFFIVEIIVDSVNLIQMPK